MTPRLPFPLSRNSLWSLLAVASLLMLFAAGHIRSELFLAFSAEGGPSGDLFSRSAYIAIRVALLGFFAYSIYRLRHWQSRFSSDGFAPNVRGADPLLSLRAFACLIVLVGHGFIFLMPRDTYGMRQPWNWFLQPAAWSGVWIFFTLSGYLIGKGFYAGRYRFCGADLAQFYRNRLLRIVPVALFILFAVALLQAPQYLRLDRLYYLAELLTLDYRSEPLQILWSINTELQFYLIAPFVCLGLFMLAHRRHGLWLVSGLIAALLAITMYARYRVLSEGGVGHSFAVSYKPLLWNLDLFLVGIASNLALARLRERVPAQLPVAAIGVATMLFIYGITSYSVTYGKGSPMWNQLPAYFFPGLTALATAVTIICFELARERGAVLGRSLFASFVRKTQMLGLLTYCLYLWQEPVYNALRRVTKPVDYLTSTGNLLVAFALILLVSLYTYYKVELPFDRKRKQSSAHD